MTCCYIYIRLATDSTVPIHRFRNAFHNALGLRVKKNCCKRERETTALISNSIIKNAGNHQRPRNFYIL